MNARKKILCVVALFLTIVTNAQLSVSVGMRTSWAYNLINSPEDSDYNFRRSGKTLSLSLGPKIDIGNNYVCLTIEGHGTYMTNKNIVTVFLNDDYKTCRSLGYGSSAMFYISPWKKYAESNWENLMDSYGNMKESSIVRMAFSIGAGWESMKTLYKIPKDRDEKNKRFGMFYGQVGYGFFSNSNSTEFYIRYGVGENKASMLAIGVNTEFIF